MQMWIKKLLLILLLCSVCQAAQIIRYVDPDAAGGGTGLDWTNAYTSLDAWEAAEQQDLTDGAGDIMTVYCRSSGGTDDTTACTILGWTTSATSYIEIIQTDFPIDGVFDGTKYLMARRSCLIISENYVRVGPLQIQMTVTGNGIGITVETIDAGGSDIRIDSCIVKGICSGTGLGYGIHCNDADVTVNIFNCIIYGLISGEDISFRGIQSTASTALNIYNCTSFGNYYGLCRTGGVMNIYNCASFNNVDDVFGAAVTDHCASDDGDGTNAQDFTAEATDWNKVFTDYTTGNVSLKDYTTSPCCVGKGVDDPGAGLYSDDIISTARTSTWDIGAFEYVAAAPPTGGQVIMIGEL